MRILGKILKFLGNFIGIILSLVLSLALIVMLVATPILSGASAFTRPETILQVVQEIDFAAIFLESFQGEMSDEERKEMEFFIELTETKAFGNLVELYATDLSNAFEETKKPSVITKEALRKIVNDNMDELIQVIRKMGENMGEDTSSYTDEQIEEEVWKNFEELADRFLEMAPTAEDLRNLMAKVSEEFTTDFSEDEERPNSGAEFVEDAYDTPSYEYDEDAYEGGGTITYLPGDGDTVTTIIVSPNGTIQSGDGNSFYYVDPETGAIVFGDGEGAATATGGKITFGKAASVQNGTIRVLLMSVGPSGGEQGEDQEKEIADIVLKLAQMAKNGTLTLVLVGVIVVLALLICLLRWPRFKGFMWVAVMLLIGAVLVALAGFAYTVLPGMLANNMGAEASVLTAAKPVIKIITNSMYIAAAIYACVAIVLIVLFVILRKALRKQKIAKAAAIARAEAIEEIADEAEAEVLAVAPCEEVCEEVPAEEEIVEAEEIPAAVEESPIEEAEMPAGEEEETAEAEVPTE